MAGCSEGECRNTNSPKFSPLKNIDAGTSLLELFNDFADPFRVEDIGLLAQYVCE